MAAIRVGTAGWVYEPWRGSFYPEGLPQQAELAHASRALTAIEINGTFYANQKPASFRAWADQTPDGFRFAVKGHQRVTHILRLKNVETALANFFASGVLALGARLGPVVWQLPPNMKYEPERLAAFLALLPQTPEAAAALARRHDETLRSEPFFETVGVPRIRHALEVRHESFAVPDFIALLRAHNVAMVIADTAEWRWQDLTADFAYLRLQGPPDGQAYSAGQRDAWADKLRAFSQGSEAGPDDRIAALNGDGLAREVYAFFVSTDKERAPHNAMAVQHRLGIVPAGPAMPEA